MTQPAGIQLERHDGRLCLSLPDGPQAGLLCVDFASAKLRFRRQRPLGAEAVVKAAGGCVDPQKNLRLSDATAGLGEDAFLLAAAGWHVSMIEQSALVHALLQDGLERAHRDADAHQDNELAAIMHRLHLCECGDSANLLASLPPARVIYLDPMFPERIKSARVKKNRYLLQQLHGEEAQGHTLLVTALQLAPKVVVKRPRLAPFLDDIRPASSHSGKTSRFDIYVGQGSADI